MSDQNKCSQCELEVLGYLKDIPKDFRTAIAKAICKVKDESTGVQCSDVKDCETTTHLSSFTVDGTEVSVTYTNEDSVNETRSFNTGDLISSYFNALDPKCLDTQSHWDSIDVIQKLQKIIDGQCLCCSPNRCPETLNLTVLPGFIFDWDNTNVATNENVISQKLSFRYKLSLGAWLTGGFLPTNDINKTINHATNTNLSSNRIYQFKLDTICQEGGPTINNNFEQEQITFQCIEPSYSVISYGFQGNTAITATLQVGPDITGGTWVNRRLADDTTIGNPQFFSAPVAGVISQFMFVPVNVPFYTQAFYTATLHGVTIHSNDPEYLNAWCSTSVFTVPPEGSPTTTTTTTQLPGSTTSSTTTTSTSTTSTTTILCPAIAGMVASSGNGSGPTTSTTSTSTTTTHTTTTTTSTSTTSTSSTSSTSTTTTTTFSGGFDTQLAFNVSTTDSDQGVTGTVNDLSLVITFNFNKVIPRVGFPQTMSINVSGTPLMTVDFYSDYAGHTFRVVDGSGVGHNGNFTNGTVNF